MGSRRGYSNGNYRRHLETRSEHWRSGSPGTGRRCPPGVFERYCRIESRMEEALRRAQPEGGRTHSVGDIQTALGGEGLSGGTISRLNGRFSERLVEWWGDRSAQSPASCPWTYRPAGGPSESMSVPVTIGGAARAFARCSWLSGVERELERAAPLSHRARAQGSQAGDWRRWRGAESRRH